MKPLLMFRGKEGSRDYYRKTEIVRYPIGVIIIFNDKVYTNRDNLK